MARYCQGDASGATRIVEYFNRPLLNRHETRRISKSHIVRRRFVLTNRSICVKYAGILEANAAQVFRVVLSAVAAVHGNGLAQMRRR